MPSPDPVALKAAFDTANWLNEVSTGVVILGVFLELIVLVVFSKEMPRHERWLLIPATAIVVLGVGGELVFGRNAANAAAQLQQLSDRTVAELRRDEARDNKIATRAAAHAADLGVTIGSLQGFVTEKQASSEKALQRLRMVVATDKANAASAVAVLNRDRANLERARSDALLSAGATRKDLAQMTSLLQQESALRNRMVSALTPRKFTQESAMEVMLAPYAPMGVDIITLGDSFEIASLAQSLSNVLTTAGWKPRLFAGLGGGGQAKGIPIQTRDGASQRTQAAAHALEQAILASGVSARVVGTFPLGPFPIAVVGSSGEENPADIRVYVAEKP